MSRVTRHRGEARKSVSPELGEWLERTANALRKHSVPTPEARFDASAQTLRAPWIGGRQGYEVLEEENNIDPFIVKAATVVAHLHRVPVSSLDLAGFDPWKKIEPRLRNRASLPNVVQGPAEEAIEMLRKRAPGDPRRTVTVHGDFHIGQIVFGSDGVTWLLDLEDMAFGEPEADLANFAAHLATSKDSQNLDLLREFRCWLALLANAWSMASETETDRARLKWYGAAALLRRALKLCERGRFAQDVTTAARAVAAARRLAEFKETTL